MKLKKLELTAVEFFERVINGEKLALDSEQERVVSLNSAGIITLIIEGEEYPLCQMGKPSTVWIEQQWYEDIPEQGVLCWTDPKKIHVCIIIKYLPHAEYQFKCTEFNGYANPIPLAPEEIKAFLPAEAVTKYDESNWAENPSIEFPVKCRATHGLPFNHWAEVTIVRYDKGSAHPFIDSNGIAWLSAIPVDE